MEFSKTNKNRLLLILPAISIFLITLIPTLSHSWPLSWDVIYHVLYAKVYTQEGFVLVNPLLNYPIGQKIGYPPLFHFLIASLGSLFRVDYFGIARALQPILAFFVILSVTYVAKKLYGTVAGLSAGFLMISSTIIYRIMLPVPENLALIFLPLAVYFYYSSVKEKSIKYAFIAGILMLIIAGTHQAALLCLIIVITALTIVEIVIYRNISIVKNYGAFLISLLGIITLAAVTIIIFKPSLLQSIFSQGLTSVLGFGTSLNYNLPLSFDKYIRNFGLLVTVFSLVGTIFAIRLRRRKDVYIFTWIISMIILSKAYYFGINVLSSRVLIYIIIPLSILGGFGVSYIYYKLKDYKRSSSRKVQIIIFNMRFSVINVIWGAKCFRSNFRHILCQYNIWICTNSPSKLI